MINSTLVANLAERAGGGINNLVGFFILTSSTLSANIALAGGGIVSSGPATVTNSTLSANSALGDGGGITMAPR